MARLLLCIKIIALLSLFSTANSSAVEGNPNIDELLQSADSLRSSDLAGFTLILENLSGKKETFTKGQEEFYSYLEAYK